MAKKETGCNSAQMRGGLPVTPCGKIPNPIDCNGCPEYSGYTPDSKKIAPTLTSPSSSFNFRRQISKLGVPTGDGTI